MLELEGGGDSVLSFFMLSHCAGGRLPSMGDTVLSNARLVDGRNKVNTAATTITITTTTATIATSPTTSFTTTTSRASLGRKKTKPKNKQCIHN